MGFISGIFGSNLTGVFAAHIVGVMLSHVMPMTIERAPLPYAVDAGITTSCSRTP